MKRAKVETAPQKLKKENKVTLLLILSFFNQVVEIILTLAALHHSCRENFQFAVNSAVATRKVVVCPPSSTKSLRHLLKIWCVKHSPGN